MAKVLDGNDYLNLIQPDDRIFVASKGGVIRTVNPSTYQVSGTYLDISARVLNNGERGLLGLAFHPQFKTNGRFFVVSTFFCAHIDRNFDTFQPKHSRK